MEGVVVAAWPNRPPVGAAGVVVAGAAVAAAPEVVEGAEVPNRLPPRGAVAGVVEGAAVDVALPVEGKRDF